MKTLKVMLLEEWRIHALMFGNRNFSFFPAIILILAFTASMFLPLYQNFLSRSQLAFIIHMIFLFFGLSVGGFGMFAQDALNRRLGDISLIAYSSRTLPISLRVLFANFVVKDTILYICFMVIPFYLAYLPARILLGLSLSGVTLLYTTIGLSFMFGLSISFILSTSYIRFGKRLLSVVMVFSFIYTLKNPAWMRIDRLSVFFPPLQYFLSEDKTYLILSVALISIFSALAIALFRSEYRLSESRFSNQYEKLSLKMRKLRYHPFLIKDLLDLHRSEGGLGKIAVSYFFPLAMVAVMISFFTNFLPVKDFHFMLIMSIMTGVVSTSLYNWLSEFDFAEQYLFLPIPASYIIKSKLILHSLASIIMGFLTIITAFIYIQPPIWTLLISFPLAIAIGYYCVSVMIYLTGLHPNTMSYNAKTMISFILMLVPPIALPVIGFLSGFLNPSISVMISAIYMTIMTPISHTLLGKSYNKWDNQENLF